MNKSELLIAVTNNDFDAVCELLKNSDERVTDKNGKPVDRTHIKNARGSTPLAIAVFFRNTQMVELLLSYGANVNTRDSFETTPLHNACENGDVDMVQLLLDKGASIDVRNKNDSTPLHRAALNGHLDVVHMLLNKANEVNQDRRKLKMTEEVISKHAKPHNFKKTYEMDVVNVLDMTDCTPLHLACLKGHLEIVKALVEAGAMTNMEDRFSETPMMWARRHNKKDIEDYLLSLRGK